MIQFIAILVMVATDSLKAGNPLMGRKLVFSCILSLLLTTGTAVNAVEFSFSISASGEGSKYAFVESDSLGNRMVWLSQYSGSITVDDSASGSVSIHVYTEGDKPILTQCTLKVRGNGKVYGRTSSEIVDQFGWGGDHYSDGTLLTFFYYPGMVPIGPDVGDGGGDPPIDPPH